MQSGSRTSSRRRSAACICERSAAWDARRARAGRVDFAGQMLAWPCSSVHRHRYTSNPRPDGIRCPFSSDTRFILLVLLSRHRPAAPPMHLPTPSTSHIPLERVYDPAEDSFLLLDALSDQSNFLSSRLAQGSPPLVLEVGTGSGVVVAFVAQHARQLLGRPDALVLATDLNPFACAAAQQTVRLQGAPAAACLLGVLRADLAAPVRPASVDLLLFNPPYVPSDHVPAPPSDLADAVSRDFGLLALATDGGADGMVITTRLLADIGRLLSPRGLAYVLLCARNKPDAVCRHVRSWDGGGCWNADVVKESGRTGGIEKLCILRVSRAAPSACA